MTHLIILNDPPYGTERSYNGLRLAMALKKRDPDLALNIFMIGDGVSCAAAAQKTPDGYYNLARMIRALLAKDVTIRCCGTCLDARGLNEESLVSGVERGSMSDLAEWTMESDNVVSF
ncbi:MAG: DsrE/DsrF/TusD sulfur relay family protein [Promethearchaeia archaeon]